MELLMTFASDYHVSLIGTVGAPKSKPCEEYSMRDGAFGSTFWARKCDLMVKVSQDFKTNLREVIVMYRNSMHEKFTFQFEAGRLVEAVVNDDETPQSVYDVVLEFMRGRDWTKVVTVAAALVVSRKRAYDVLQGPAFEKSPTLYPNHYRLRGVVEDDVVGNETLVKVN